MRGAMMCLLVVCVVSVAAQLDDFGRRLYFDDANIMKSIPSNWNIADPSTVIGIEVININVDKIEANAFENFTSLKVLVLSGKITGIEDWAFRGLTEIENIKVGANDIQNIGLNVFSNLNNLKRLSMDRNKIKEIRLNNLPMLERLDLYHNEITKLNNNTFIDLQKLVFIAMDKNNIRSIKSGTFSGCPNLIELYLIDNQLVDIEADVFRDLYKLEVLHLRNNNLTTITPNHFQGLTSLEILDLSRNKILSLDPLLLYNLTELTDISFYNNSITSLSERFFNSTPKLEYLDFDFNLFKEFHLYDNLVHLRHVSLEHNQIESIELSAPTQRNIEVLDLSDNNLTHLDESFQHLINLQYLLLNNNTIKSFPLCIPGSLTVLDLSHNELHGVALDQFCGSETRGKLEIVNVSFNQFTSYNLTHNSKSLQETQPDLNKIDLSRNILNAEIIKFIQVFKLRDKLNLIIKPQRKLEVEVNDSGCTNNELNQNDVETKHGNATTDNRNEKQNTTWIVVTSVALAVAVFAVIAAILYVYKQRRRTNLNPNVNDAVMLDELYDDVGPARAVYHYPRFPPFYDDVGVQPTYLAVLPDIPGPQPLEQQDNKPEDNHYEEIG